MLIYVCGLLLLNVLRFFSCHNSLCFDIFGTFFVYLVKHRVEQRLEQMSRPQGVRLHTAHVLCMDAILNVGLEMGSHNHDCWPHVFRYTYHQKNGIIDYKLKS